MAKEVNTVGYTESRDYRCLEDLEEDRTGHGIGLINLDYCGKERCKSEYSFGPYTRKNYVLHVVHEGKGQLWIKGMTYNISANQAFLLVPGIETVYKADRETPWVYSWIGFHGYQCDKIVRSMGFSENCYVIDVDNAAALGEYIDRMLDHSELTYANFLRRNAFMQLLIGDIISQADIPESDEQFSEETYVNMAMKTIMTNYSQPITIAGIADQIGINRSYLSVIFKKKTGISPQQFLMNYRMEMAAGMLSESNLPIRAVSACVGYRDSLTFSKAFKLKYGVSPSEYKEHPVTLKTGSIKGEYMGIHKL